MNVWTEILCGDSLTLLKSFPDGCVDCVVCSPPYFGLRCYNIEPMIWGGAAGCEHEWVQRPPRRSRKEGDVVDPTSKQATMHGSNFDLLPTDSCTKCGAWLGSLGNEPTFPLYIDHLCSIFDEVYRVLKPTGSCFAVLGDTYSNSGGSGSPEYEKRHTEFGKPFNLGRRKPPLRAKGLPSKCLCQIPSRFAIEMCNRGWTLRNEVVWHKRNCLPSSCRDRFTVDFEKVFFFVKQEKYYFEQQFEPMVYPERKMNSNVTQHKTRILKELGNRTTGGLHDGRTQYGNPDQGRNTRCVWSIPTQPSSEPHFAMYPEKLVEPLIKAGCPEQVCKKCGKPRVAIYQRKKFTRLTSETKYDTDVQTAGRLAEMRQAYRAEGLERPPSPELVGFTDCGCNAGFDPGVVLDPFMGMGTTMLVARRLGRNSIGIELNNEYCQKAEQRICKTLKLERL